MFTMFTKEMFTLWKPTLGILARQYMSIRWEHEHLAFPQQHLQPVIFSRPPPTPALCSPTPAAIFTADGMATTHPALRKQGNLPLQRGVAAPCLPPASVFASPPPQPSSALPSAAGPPASSSALPGAFHSAAGLALLFLTRRFLAQLWGQTGRFDTGKLRT